MKDFYDDIAEKIDSEEYFEDAKELYMQKYMYPVIERSFFILITVISLLISVVSVYVLIDFLPLRNPIPMAIGIPDSSKEFATIKYLGSADKKSEETKGASNNIIIKYLSEKYVKSQEAYDYINNFTLLDRNYNFINQFSSDEIVKKYKYSISIRNPNSIMLKYKQHTSRKIEIDGNSTIILKDNSQENSEKYVVFIDFYATETNKHAQKTTKWKSIINLNFKDISYNREDSKFDEISYAVTAYRSAEIE